MTPNIDVLRTILEEHKIKAHQRERGADKAEPRLATIAREKEQRHTQETFDKIGRWMMGFYG